MESLSVVSSYFRLVSLQPIPARCFGRTIGRGATVAELIFNPDDRLLGKRDARRGSGRWLRPNSQPIGRANDFCERAKAGGSVGHCSHCGRRVRRFGERAAGQRPAHRRAHAEILPGERIHDPAARGACNGEGNLRRGDRGDRRAAAAGCVVDVLAVCTGAADPIYSYGRSGAARIKDESGWRVKDNRSGAHVSGNRFIISRPGQIRVSSARAIRRDRRCARGPVHAADDEGSADGAGQAGGRSGDLLVRPGVTAFDIRERRRPIGCGGADIQGRVAQQ